MPHSIKVAAKMMHELACEFVHQGHSVTVITPSPGLSQMSEITVLDGVTVCRFKSGEIKNISKIKRAINETLLSYHAWKPLKSYLADNPHDLIVYYSPTIFFGSLVSKLKKLWGAKTYLILRDLFPQWAVDQGLIKQGSMIEKYFRYFEKKNYSVADTIGLMSPKNLDLFRNSFVANSRLEVLYNWAEDKAVKSKNYYKKALNIENKIVYFYGGNIGHAQDMMNIVRLAKNMLDYPQAHFVLVGAGDEVEIVQKAIASENLINMTLLPSVGQDEFKLMLAEFGIGLFSLDKNHTTHNFPGKLLGYMVQNLPILGSVNMGNDLRDVVEEFNAGLISINGEDDLFLSNAIMLLDEDTRQEIGKNANNLLREKFSVKSACFQILKAI